MFKVQNKKFKWAAALSLVFVMLASTAGAAFAAEFPKGETIPAGETIDDDVFISGEKVVVDGVVNGVLIAAGQTVILNGTVNGDAILMGESVAVSEGAVIDGNLFVGAADVVVNGTVTGTVFGGSTSMILGGNAEVSRNFFYGGFSLTTMDGSAVGKDLYSGNYQSILSGDVARDLKLGAGAVELAGTVGRNAAIEIGDESGQDDPMDWMQFNPYFNQYVDEMIQPGIRVADDAQIGGKLTYTSSVDRTEILDEITQGTVVFQTPVPSETGKGLTYSTNKVQPFNRSFFNIVSHTMLMRSLRNFIKLMALGALTLWLLRKPFLKVVDFAYAEPMKAFGWGFIAIAVGFLALFVVPLVFIMVGVLIGLISLGSLLYVWFGLAATVLTLAFMLFFFAVFTFSKIIAAYMFGKWIMKVVFKETQDKVWLNLLAGTFLYIIIRSIPFIGWIAGLAATLIGSGALWLTVTAKRK